MNDTPASAAHHPIPSAGLRPAAGARPPAGSRRAAGALRSSGARQSESTTPTHRTGSGIALALTSAASFALSGSFASALFSAGWSAGAAVTVRVAIAGLVLLPPAVRMIHGRWHLLRSNLHLFILFGVLAVAGAQLFYFMAVQTLSVGVALMLEYMGLVLVVFWQAITTRRAPQGGTLAGVALAIVGLLLVLDLFGGVRIDTTGVLWGLGAAVGLATYYIVAGNEGSDVPPLVLAAGGMLLGAVALGAIGLAGLLPMHVSSASVVLAGMHLPWFVAVGVMGLVTGAVAYSTGVAAAQLLGAKVSAFVGLTEVLFAVLFAWILLDELPGLVQLGGGLLILLGIAAVRREQLADDAAARRAVEPEGPDGASMATMGSERAVLDSGHGQQRGG